GRGSPTSRAGGGGAARRTPRRPRWPPPPRAAPFRSSRSRRSSPEPQIAPPRNSAPRQALAGGETLGGGVSAAAADGAGLDDRRAVGPAGHPPRAVSGRSGESGGGPADERSSTTPRSGWVYPQL